MMMNSGTSQQKSAVICIMIWQEDSYSLWSFFRTVTARNSLQFRNRSSINFFAIPSRSRFLRPTLLPGFSPFNRRPNHRPSQLSVSARSPLATTSYGHWQYYYRLHFCLARIAVDNTSSFGICRVIAIPTLRVVTPC